MIVKVDDLHGIIGENVEAVIRVERAENVGIMDISLEFDPEILLLKDVLLGSLTVDSIVEDSPGNGFVNIFIKDVNGFSGSGSILRAHAL